MHNEQRTYANRLQCNKQKDGTIRCHYCDKEQDINEVELI